MASNMGKPLECGTVRINPGLIRSVLKPFGGLKNPGFGREGPKYGIEDYPGIEYPHIGGVDCLANAV